MSDISRIHPRASTEKDIAIIVMSQRRVKFDVISGRKHKSLVQGILSVEKRLMN